MMIKKPLPMKFIDFLVQYTFMIGFVLGIFYFATAVNSEFNFLNYKDLPEWMIMIHDISIPFLPLFKRLIFVVLIAWFVLGIITYIKNIYDRLSKLANIENAIHKEVMSLQYGGIERLNSEIIERILSKKSISEFVLEDLKLVNFNGGDEKLTVTIYKAFEKAKENKFAKACCVINDKKFIEIDKWDEDSIGLAEYFINHKFITDKNLQVSRIFSFPSSWSENDDCKTIDIDNSRYRYILFIYLIANYYGGVKTYLHSFKKENNISLINDYVSLTTHDGNNQVNYKAYFAQTDNNDIESIMIVPDDMMLALALEKDFASRLKNEETTDGVNGHSSYIAVTPLNYNLLIDKLGIHTNKKETQKKLKVIISEINDTDLNKKYKKAIELFFK